MNIYLKKILGSSCVTCHNWNFCLMRLKHQLQWDYLLVIRYRFSKNISRHRRHYSLCLYFRKYNLRASDCLFHYEHTICRIKCYINKGCLTDCELNRNRFLNCFPQSNISLWSLKSTFLFFSTWYRVVKILFRNIIIVIYFSPEKN